MDSFGFIWILGKFGVGSGWIRGEFGVDLGGFGWIRIVPYLNIYAKTGVV